ncbi:hypothetical protein KC951_02200 [Candidatus Saccharibacteria bacterium]|nr:hypothetical protein [Candidatus Saccharibacteria bacterium]
MRYPFKSGRIRKIVNQGTEGVDYLFWREKGFDIQKTINGLQGEILEIGGPTPDGYFFLDEVNFTRKAIIANLEEKPWEAEEYNQKYARYVDKIIDVRELPYADGTLGMIFFSGLTVYSDDIKVSSQKQADGLLHKAYSELEAVGLGILKPADAEVSLRVMAGLEAYRSLESGGLLITDGYLPELLALERIGFKRKALISVYDDQPTLYYEMVFEK